MCTHHSCGPFEDNRRPFEINWHRGPLRRAKPHFTQPFWNLLPPPLFCNFIQWSLSYFLKFSFVISLITCPISIFPISFSILIFNLISSLSFSSNLSLSLSLFLLLTSFLFLMILLLLLLLLLLLYFYIFCIFLSFLSSTFSFTYFQHFMFFPFFFIVLFS